MSVQKPTRLAKAASYFNVGKDEIVDFLLSKGFSIDNNPNAKIEESMLAALGERYNVEHEERAESNLLGRGGVSDRNEELQVNTSAPEPIKSKEELTPPAPEPKPEPEVVPMPEPEMVLEDEKELDSTELEEKDASDENEKTIEESNSTKEEEPKSKFGLKIIATLDANSLEPSSRFKKKEPKKTAKKEEPKKIEIEKAKQKEEPIKEKEITQEEPIIEPVIDTAFIEADVQNAKSKSKPVTEPEPEHIETKFEKLQGAKILGTVDLSTIPTDRGNDKKKDEKKKRARIKENNGTDGDKTRVKFDKAPIKEVPFKKPKKEKEKKEEYPNVLSKNEIDETIRRTEAKMGLGNMSKGLRQKIRKKKREKLHESQRANEEVVNDKLLKITEFITVSDLANLMNITPSQIITFCFGMGVVVSINQRLDAELIELITSEFEYEVEFISLEDSSSEEIIEEDESKLQPRAPIVTIMGHVDHGKTSLLDYIRKANVVNKEAGGITQHIGAYDVKVPGHDRKITFIDTPGHEAFTAMRARGAKITDVAVIVIAADDKVMPQTREAISHAQSANVPMIFALNKIDKEDANPDAVRAQLSEMNLLVESWGGKFQEQEISAKKGIGIDDLLEKILLEADMLDLKANPDREANGTVIEASLDKGRGYVATVLVLGGTLKVGDFVVAGSSFGKIKAMTNHLGEKLTKVVPGQPVQILGLNGAPSAGENFKVYADEQEAKQIAYKRSQIEREQGIRTKKHITLDEIGRRLALGTFKELNIIIKGDVDGSVQALTDSLIKLSTEEIEVNVLHKAVGPISESDVLLASASDAIIIGFQVRPTAQAKAIAEKESIDIRHYSVIYQAIDEIKAAMEGMLEPTVEERITGNLEIKEIFKIPKIGTIAGCMVTDGKVYKSSKVRIIREGIVVFTGELDSLKRFKDDAKEVVQGQDCGLSIKNYSDIMVGDIIEAYEEIEIKRTL